MKSFLGIFLSVCGALGATGLDTAIFIQSGTSASNAVSSRVTVSSLTNLNAGSIVATNIAVSSMVKVDGLKRLTNAVAGTDYIAPANIDTIGEIETLAGGVNIIVSTEIDTIGELETLLGGVNVILATEIDTSAELAAILTDESGAAGVFPRFSITSGAQGDVVYWNGTSWVNLGPGTSGQFLKTQGAGANVVWATATGTGDFVGPASSTDNAVVRFDSTTGKLGQNSGVTIDDSDNVTIPGTITTGNGTVLGAIQLGDSDNSAAYRLQATNAMTTNINEIMPVAPYPGLLYWVQPVAGVSNVIRNATNTVAGLNTILGSTLFNDTRTLTLNGTANEITSSAGAQDLSANRTWTFSLPSALTFTGKTITGGSYSSPTLTTPTISGAIAFPDGVRQTFNPDATIPGLNVGSQAGNPSSLSNGDIWYDSTGQAMNARINGATVALGSGGTTVNSTGGPLFVSTADAVVANTTTETTIFGSGTGTKTLPANYITAGKNFRVLVRGRMGTKAVAPGNLTIKFKLGSTVIWSAIIAPAISLANDYFEFVGDFTGRTTGASGTVFAQAIAAYNDGTTTTVNAPIAANTGTSTIDTTATQVVDVTATWATADANNTITGSIGVIMDGTGGTVTSTAGSLTSNAIVLGAGGTDTKVSSSITTDGTAKVTLGTLDVGNTTDTTISRPSAGDISVEGNIVYRAGGTDVPVTDGGTGISVGTSGGITYFSGTTTMASSAALAANAIVIGGGAGATPATTTTGTGVLTAIGNTANATGGIVTVDGTATLVNKTLAVANNDITGFPVTIGIACSDETTAITTGTGKATFRVPFAFTLTEVRATVTTAPTGSTIIIDINESGTTVMTTTKLSIDATEKTSTTALNGAAITDSAIADDAEITIDFDQVGSTVSGAGVKIWLIGTRTI